MKQYKFGPEAEAIDFPTPAHVAELRVEFARWTARFWKEANLVGDDAVLTYENSFFTTQMSEELASNSHATHVVEVDEDGIDVLGQEED